MTTGLSRAEDGIPVVANQGARDARFPNPAVDQRVQNLGTGYFERWTGTLWAQETPIFALGQADGFPVVANAAARDAKFPIPALNQRVERADTGYKERWDSGSGTWRPEGILRSIGPLVGALARGAKGDGATDDSVALADMDAKVLAYNDGGWGEIDPSPTGQSYFINTNFTFNANVRAFGKGSRIKVGAGKTVTFMQDFDARLFKVFDLSAAGSKLVWQQKRAFQMEWFVDPAATDASPQFNAAFGNTPDYSTIFSDTFGNVHIKSAIGSTNTRQKSWICRVSGFPDGAGYTVEWWGPKGGSMFQSNSNDHLSLVNCAFRPTPNSTVEGFDGYIAAGSNIFHAKGYPIFDGSMTLNGGRQIWIKGVGVAGADLIANITGFTDGNTVTISANASTAVLNTVLTPFVVGPSSDSLPCGIGIEVFGDILGGATGTANTFKRCFVRSNMGVDWMTGIYLASDAPVGQNNQEYHHIEECTCTQGLGAIAFNGAGSIAGGSAVFNAIDVYFALFYVGRRFRLLLDNGTEFDTKIIATNATISANGNQVTLKDVAPSAATGARIIIGESLGVGLRNGASPNAKRQILENNTFAGFRLGIWFENGSFLYTTGSMTNNEWDFQRDSSTEPSYIVQHNSEASRHIFKDGDAGLTVHAPLRFVCGRFGSSYMEPGKGNVKIGAASTFVSFIDCQFDDPVPAREIGPGWTRFFEFIAGWNGVLEIERVVHELGSPLPTAQALGFDQLDSINGTWRVTSRDMTTNGLARTWDSGSVGSLNPGLNYESLKAAFANNYTRRIAIKQAAAATATALIVDADQGSVSVASDVTGIDVNVGRNFSGGVNAGTFRGIRVNGPLWNDGGGISADLPYYTGTPPVSTGGNVTRLIFLDIPDMLANGHVNEAFSVRQLGTGQKNKFLGRIFQAAPASAPADADLDPGTKSFWTDEAGNFSKARVRYSGGGYKTETSAGLI